MKIVLDTAILVRANVRAKGPGRELVLLLAQAAGHNLVVSAYLLAEVQRVLKYPRMQFMYELSPREIEDHARYLELMSEVVEPAEGPPVVLKDPKDDPVVYTAIAGQAHVLCTVDKHFYEPDVLAFCSRHKIRVMTDIELLRLLRELAATEGGPERNLLAEAGAHEDQS